MQSKTYGMIVFLGGLGIALGGCSPLFEGDRTIATGNNTENILIQNEQYLEETEENLAEKADLILDTTYGTEYITLLSGKNCSSYRNEKYGFILQLPDNWDDTCAVEEYVTVNSETKQQGISLRFYFFNDKLPRPARSDSKILPNGWYSPFRINIKNIEDYNGFLSHLENQTFEEPIDIEEDIGHNDSHYFLLIRGNIDRESWGQIAFGWNPPQFTEYIKEHFQTFDIGEGSFQFSGGNEVVVDEGYGIVSYKLIYYGSCNHYKNETYGFEIQLPNEWDDNCVIQQSTTIFKDGTETNNLRFFYFYDVPERKMGTSSHLLPNGWQAPFQVIIIDDKNYYADFWEDQIGGRERLEQDTIAKNTTYYFRFDIGNGDREDWKQLSFGWEPMEFIDYFQKHFKTFDV